MARDDIKQEISQTILRRGHDSPWERGCYRGAHFAADEGG